MNSENKTQYLQITSVRQYFWYFKLSHPLHRTLQWANRVQYNYAAFSMTQRAAAIAQPQLHSTETHRNPVQIWAWLERQLLDKMNSTRFGLNARMLGMSVLRPELLERKKHNKVRYNTHLKALAPTKAGLAVTQSYRSNNSFNRTKRNQRKHATDP